MDDDDAEMMKLMGFAAFGDTAASRRNSRHQQVRGRRKQVQQSQNAPLAQVVPGTELHALLAIDTPAAPYNRFERSTHGVTFLVNTQPDTSSNSNVLAALLRADNATSHRPLESSRQLLPAHCYERLQELDACKSRFDAIDAAVFQRARNIANPFERIGRGLFLNRSAMKLVNMDHMFEWTASTTATTTSTTADASPQFTFADVCGGPGGFSEYLLWRVPQRSATARISGFGITLKHATCDWTLSPSSSGLPAAAPSSASSSFTISYGADNTGDLYQLANIHAFRGCVRAQHPRGVALVVADGGFQDARDQTHQEQCMTRLVLAETLTMFTVLQTSGSFVLKTFELTTRPMVTLVWLLHQCFTRVTIVKPVTSRPASSERYIVALERRAFVPIDAIVAVLETHVAASAACVYGLVPDAVVHSDALFHTFLAAVSDCFALAQLAACRQILDVAAALVEEERGGSTRRVDKRKRHRDDDAVDAAAYLRCWHLAQRTDSNDTSV